MKKSVFFTMFVFMIFVLPVYGAAKESKGMTDNIYWLGHDCFKIKGSKVVYIDPFKISGGEPADIILITHDHFDHASPEDVEKIQGKDTVIVGTEDSLQKLKGNKKFIKVGEKVNVGGIEIEAVPAYNTNKQFHPKSNGWVGFIVNVDGVKIYHAGDTDYIPEMKNFKTDVALLPVSGTYVMTADEAVKAALDINPKVAIPMHYGAIVGSADDAVKFKEALKGKVEVVIKDKQ